MLKFERSWSIGTSPNNKTNSDKGPRDGLASKATNYGLKLGRNPVVDQDGWPWVSRIVFIASFLLIATLMSGIVGACFGDDSDGGDRMSTIVYRVTTINQQSAR